MTVDELPVRGIAITEKKAVKLGLRLSEDKKRVEVCISHGDETLSVVGVSPETAEEMAVLLRSLSLEIRNGGRQGS